jgi:eukaryotic-like serine/threonine-protein kinase
MKELGIKIGDKGRGTFRFGAGLALITVRESSPMEVGEGLENLGGFALSGRLYFGPERVYGRFTQARWRDGTTYPICVELGERHWLNQSLKWTPGVPREDVGGPADSAVVFPTQSIRAVERFE